MVKRLCMVLLLLMGVLAGVGPALASTHQPTALGAPLEEPTATPTTQLEEPTATPNTPDVGIDCGNAVDVGLTIRDGDFVKGSGSWTRCDNSFTRIDILLYRMWPGWNQPKHHLTFNPADFGSHAHTVLAYCGGTKGNWITRIIAHDLYGHVIIDKWSNVLKATC